VGAGLLWISESNSGNVSVHDLIDKSWKQWKLPGEKPHLRRLGLS